MGDSIRVLIQIYCLIVNLLHDLKVRKIYGSPGISRLSVRGFIMTTIAKVYRFWNFRDKETKFSNFIVLEISDWKIIFQLNRMYKSNGYIKDIVWNALSYGECT